MTTPLQGLRVIDLTTTIAGATCTMLLADFGAEVVRLTTAALESARDRPAFVGLDRGSTRLFVDDMDSTRLDEILAGADVIVTALPGEEAVELSAVERVRAANPTIVMMHMPPSLLASGEAGRIESAGMLTASLGLGFRQYSTGGVPVDPVYPHVLYAHGAWSAVCTVATLIERLESGCGQTVTVGGEQGALISAFATFGSDPAQPSLPPPGPGGPNPFYTRYRCADDRWVFLGSLTPKFQRVALATLGLTDLLEDPRIAGDLDATGSGENRDWVRARFEEAFLTRSSTQWIEALRAADCPVGELLRREDWLDHPQIRAIGMRAEFEHPDVGAVVMPGVPLSLSATPALAPAAERTVTDLEAPRGPAPHAARETARSSEGPLAGVRALNLGVVLAGPLAGNLLAELGADVIKIEPPTGDPFRDKGFHYNRGMRSLAIDLRDPRGLAQFEDLVRGADLVLDNFRSGVLERLCIDHASLTQVNPRISSISITGFGTTGPFSETPGFDPVLGAMSGMMYAQGGDDDPVMLTLAINDVTAGVMAAFGACLAVYAQRTGRAGGQRATTSLAAASAFAQTGELTRYENRPPADVGGADYLGPTPYDRAYRTSDGWVRIDGDHVASSTPPTTGIDRGAAPGADSIETDLARLTTAEALTRLAQWGIPAVRARTMIEATAAPEALAIELFHPLAKSNGGEMMVPGRLARFDRTPRTVRLVPPGLGEHSRTILTEAGVPASTVGDLVGDGVVVESGPMHITGMPGYR